jgi:hypothetical protein
LKKKSEKKVIVKVDMLCVLVALLVSVLPLSMADGLHPSHYSAVTSLYSSLGEIEFFPFFFFSFALTPVQGATHHFVLDLHEIATAIVVEVVVLSNASTARLCGCEFFFFFVSFFFFFFVDSLGNSNFNTIKLTGTISADIGTLSDLTYL